MIARMDKPRVFDWRRIKWGGPRDGVARQCSYCGAPIGDDDTPLRLWTAEGWSATFGSCCDDMAYLALLACPESETHH